MKEPMSKRRLIQILILLVILVLAFIWRTVEYYATSNFLPKH